MKQFLKLVLRSQTVFSHIQIVLIIFSRSVVFALLQYTNDREAFSCIPKLNASIEQLCYDNYTSSYNLGFNIVGAVDVTFCAPWLVLAIFGSFPLRNMKRDRQNQICQPMTPAVYMWIYLIFAGLRIFSTVSVVLMDCLRFGVPSTYKCSLANDKVPISFNQTRTEYVFSCQDQHYKMKSNLEIDFLTTNVFIMGLCILDLIYLKTFTPPAKFLAEALGVTSELPVIIYSENQPQGESQKLKSCLCLTPYHAGTSVG